MAMWDKHPIRPHVVPAGELELLVTVRMKTMTNPDS
jgi:hypothetical protein